MTIVMAWLPLALALLCSSAVAENLPNKVSTAAASEHSAIHVPPEGFRLSGNLELDAAGAGIERAAAPVGGDIPSNGSSAAAASGRSAWRLGEPMGYYPAHRGVSTRF